MLHNGWGVAGDKIFVFTQPEYHAAGVADARRYDLIGFIRRHQYNDISTLNLVERLARGFHEPYPCSEIMLHQMDDGFRICLCLELHAFCHQLILEFKEIFDDAILDDHHSFGLSRVWMRIT